MPTHKAKATKRKKMCPFVEFVEKRAIEAANKAGDKVRERLAPRAEFAADMYASLIGIRDKEKGKHTVHSPEYEANLRARIWTISGEFFEDTGHKKGSEGD